MTPSKKIAEPSAEVTRRGAIDMQVCVPESWTDEEIKEFADVENFCGTTHGWHIRKDEQSLSGDPYRNPCHERKGFIHVALDA